jgi:hypothetical protein
MTWMRLLRDHSMPARLTYDQLVAPTLVFSTYTVTWGPAAPVPARLGQGGGRQGQHGQEGDRGHELSQTLSPGSVNP